MELGEFPQSLLKKFTDATRDEIQSTCDNVASVVGVKSVANPETIYRHDKVINYPRRQNKELHDFH